jgi:DNA repair exonuclease SbcCD ATPase subunit
MIIFKTVSYRNFLSTGNTPNVILLNRVPSVLITGQNGSGKSTILDALCFGVFGKPYRNINKPQLMNTVNEKNLEVQVEFSINGVDYKVVRGLKPNKFEVYRNEKLLPHDAAIKDYQKRLEDILGLNYRAFTQIVILGSARYQSFMDLPTNDRRVIIEEILDITVFSKMNNILKTKAQNTDLDLKENDYIKEIIKTKISGQKGLINNLVNRSKESEEKIIAEKNKIDGQINLIEEKITHADSDINLIELIDVTELQDKLTSARFKGQQIKQKRLEVDSKIKFYQDNDHCYVCEQNINSDLKNKQVTVLQEEVDKLENLKPVVITTYNTLEEKIKQAHEVKEQYDSIIEVRRDLVNQKKALVTLYSNLNVRTQESDTLSLKQAQDELTVYDKEFKELEKKSHELVELKHYYEICKILLKDDGIKAKIIKQYLPVMNQLINRYLDRMGANYSFHLDESFNEVIKSRYRDTFSYASFSEGEKMRIDLALMFTWREIAKLKNSVNTNLLIMDEVGDSSLDAEATDVLWDILAGLEKTNVFVISHKGQNSDRFKSLVEFYKDGNFSKIIDSKK